MLPFPIIFFWLSFLPSSSFNSGNCCLI
jgi:hypothetical protein